MRTEYVLLHRSGARCCTSEQVGPGYATVAEARAAAGHPDEADWYVSPSGSVVLTAAARHRGGYENDLPWILSEQQVPETDAERVQLATDLILNHGWVDGDHHKMWVLDQVLRLLVGDRYDQVIDEYCAGEDGPETYSWDTGIAP